MIPKIIHRIWFNFKKTEEGASPPQNYIDQDIICKDINNDYKFVYWDENKCENFMKTNFPKYYRLYKLYKFDIQRVDMVRYFILYSFGGIYIDMDVHCLRHLEELDEDKVNLVEDVNQMSFYKLNNFFMASPKNHPFWLHVFIQLLKSYNNFLYHKSMHIMESTGPGMLDKAFESYPYQNNINVLSKDIYNPCDKCGNCIKSDSYILHSHDAGWIVEKNQVDISNKIICHLDQYKYIYIILGIFCGLLMLNYFYIKFF